MHDERPSVIASICMHVVIDGRVLTHRFPGIGRYVSQLTPALTEVADGDRVTVITVPNRAASSDGTGSLVGVPAVTLVPASAGIWSPSAQWRLPRILRSTGADVYHATYWAMPYRPGVPTVLSIYDLIGLHVAGSLPAGRSLALRIALRLALRSSARVLTLSEWSKQDLVRTLSIPPERITVTPLAADARFSPASAASADALRERFGLSRPYVLYVGINKPHKNLSTLVRAWAQARARLWPGGRAETEALLAIAGPWDPRYPEARELAEELAPSAVRFLGRVPDADLPALYASALAFAFPSKHEGFGLPPLEAMASGTPVIAADATSLPEVIGDAGLLVSAGDVNAWSAALERLVLDGGLRRSLAGKGLSRARAFTWKRTAELTREAYLATALERG